MNRGVFFSVADYRNTKNITTFVSLKALNGYLMLLDLKIRDL